jgi:hypothetical protein
VSDTKVRDGGYRGAIAAVVAVVLLVAGGLVIRSGVSAREDPPAPAADQAPLSSAAPESPVPPTTPAAASPTETTQAASPSEDPVPAPSDSPVASPTATKSATQKPAKLKFGPILPRSEPVAVKIPSIGVDRGGIIKLGRLANGEMQVPKDFDDVGWYEPGPAPGQFGPAVLAGHVDSKAGPAVFWKLGEMKRGDKVQVTRADGKTATFVVDGVEQYAKDKFPTLKVYSNTTNRSELRLITCGGSFDRKIGHYRDNIVVYAHQV